MDSDDHMILTDPDGDAILIERNDEPEFLAYVRTPALGVNLTEAHAREIRDYLTRLLGEERKASPETLDDARALLLEAGKSLIRKAGPVDGGDLIVFMEPS